MFCSDLAADEGHCQSSTSTKHAVREKKQRRRYRRDYDDNMSVDDGSGNSGNPVQFVLSIGKF